MPEPQFFQTAMGRTYYDHTLPRIATALETLVEQQAAMVAAITTLNANLDALAKTQASREASP